jgi:metal-responsive CopG/Arc/MetJ family transcriptional regulator
MQQAKISLSENQIRFIEKYQELGFKDRSSLVRTAIEEYIKSLHKQALIQSAKLYAEVYEEDSDLKELTNSALDLL